jgi:hypothetical protein
MLAFVRRAVAEGITLPGAALGVLLSWRMVLAARCAVMNRNSVPAVRVLEGEVLRPGGVPDVPLVRMGVSRSGPLAISICVRFTPPVVVEAEFSVLGSASPAPSASLSTKVRTL